MKLRGADGKFSFNMFFLLVAAKPTAQESCTVQHFPPQSYLHHRPVEMQRNHPANADGNQAASRDVVKEVASAAEKSYHQYWTYSETLHMNIIFKEIAQIPYTDQSSRRPHNKVH